MIEAFRHILESDIGITIAFVLTVLELFVLIRSAGKDGGFTIAIIVLLTLGLIVPIGVLIVLPWKGALYIILNILSVLLILGFVGFVLIVWIMTLLISGSKRR